MSGTIAVGSNENQTGDRTFRLVVLASGGGSNLQAILDAISDGRLNVEIAAVLSDVPDAHALVRARSAGIHTQAIDFSSYEDRIDFDAELMRSLDRLQPDLVVLAGFMRILPAQLVERWGGRIINIHPSLLPAYRGLHTHRRVLADGEQHHGATVHFVVPALDAGPIIIQARLIVEREDDEPSLAARVLVMEHHIYPLAIQWLSERRLTIAGDQVLLDGARSPQQSLTDCLTDCDGITS